MAAHQFREGRFRLIPAVLLQQFPIGSAHVHNHIATTRGNPPGNLNVYLIDAPGPPSKFRDMSICCIRKHRPAPTRLVASVLKQVLLVSVLVLAWNGNLATTRGATADDQYLQIFNSIEKADELAAKNKSAEAKAKYLEAQKQLSQFRKTFPTYNTKLVNFRLNDLTGKIDALALAEAAAAATNATETITITRHPAAAGLQIKLLEPGAEPRQVLRLQAKSQEVQRVKISARMTMGLSMPNQPGQTIKTPTAVMSATVTTQEANAQGEIGYEVVINDVTVQPEEGAMKELVVEMQKSLGAAKGMVLNGIMTDRYQTKKIEAKSSLPASPSAKEDLETLKETFSNSEFVLPEEAVGVGAKWELKHKKKKRGMLVDETIVHEITALEGSIVTVKSTLTQSGASQKISNPLMPALKVDMNKMTGTVLETTTVDLTKAFPTQATVNESSEVNMSMANAGQKQTLTMKSETQSTLETE